ncbi:uncharacterized protein ACA1_107500, partial [Acanthamoeba castellanii str. Neff]
GQFSRPCHSWHLDDTLGPLLLPPILEGILLPWPSFEALSFAFYGGLGAIAEFLDALIPNANFSESHLDHIHVTSALCVVGIIELLHLYKVLDNPAWGLVMPGGLVFVATLFTAHPQAYDLESFAHAFTAFLFWVTAISRALEIFAGTEKEACNS